MEPTYQSLVDRVLTKWDELKTANNSTTSSSRCRLLIALAGAPGSGKTTIALEVLKRINALPNHPKTTVISADGFHLPLATLRAMPNAVEAIARRGAAWTFDGAGFVTLVRKLRSAAGCEAVLAPTFDHAIKDPVEGGLTVDKDVEVCIIEGNYLLCGEDPWREIAELVDDRWLVNADPALARKRVAARHLAAGIETTMEAALKRTDENDLVNGRFVMETSLGRYDLLIESLQEQA
ncbi:P-loop containing nucleoside triphosphate hydrolase protein [Hypomontagnella monticulosa]|nr:P-loop containing nucleoside triphosphate hydrolase protein [Hypomontagnella monticulosa]